VFFSVLSVVSVLKAVLSGFRVKPGMTTHFFDGGHFFASPGVLPQSAAKARANTVCPYIEMRRPAER
jgi:hypothetical protein